MVSKRSVKHPKLVNEAIKKVCQNHTTIMIAHRSSTIAMADEVIAIG